MFILEDEELLFYQSHLFNPVTSPVPGSKFRTIIVPVSNAIWIGPDTDGVQIDRSEIPQWLIDYGPFIPSRNPFK